MAFSTEPRYIPGRNQTHLRYALWSDNNQCCYICELPKPFDVMQIDHIIPQKLEKKAEEIYNFVMDAGFPGMHSLANLGPACQPCNDAHKKGDKVFSNGMLADYLGNALKRTPRITEALSKRKGAKAISTAGATVLLADIADAAQRAAVRAFAESMLGTIAAAGGSLSEYETFESVDSDLGERQSTATALWTRETREIEATLRLHWRQDVRRVLKYSLDGSWSAAAKDVQNHFTGAAGWNGPTQGGTPNPQYLVAEITADSYSTWRDGYAISGFVKFAAEGVLDVVQPDSDGVPVGDNEDFSVQAEVAFELKYSPSEPEPIIVAYAERADIEDYGWPETLQQ